MLDLFVCLFVCLFVFELQSECTPDAPIPKFYEVIDTQDPICDLAQVCVYVAGVYISNTKRLGPAKGRGICHNIRAWLVGVA